MSPAAEAGGGGGGASLILDHGTLSSVSHGLEAAAEELDRSGGSTPGTGGTGEAAALLNLILARVTETGARLAFEAATISQTVRECNSTVADVDRAQAEAYLCGMPGSGG